MDVATGPDPTDRLTDLSGAVIIDDLTPDEARAHHARLCSEGTSHLWERWGGEHSGYNNVARHDGQDDVHGVPA